MNVPDDQGKDKTEYEIWDMQIPEGLFAKWDNQASTTQADKRFNNNTKYEIRKCIDTVYYQVLLRCQGKIRYA